MYKSRNLIAPAWSDYELLDSGDLERLERYGDIVIIRPEPQALWKKGTPAAWKSAMATFSRSGTKAEWNTVKKIPAKWPLQWETAKFFAKLTSFKHTGIFPEQTPNWQWIAERTEGLRAPRVLNLFGYTGIASIVSSLSGASVTHVDASRQSIAWAKENAELSEVSAGGIRYILDDALKFSLREARRKAKYDGIILDPPAFGRGAKGEVWKIEEQLPELIETLKKLFSDVPGSFFLLNGYAAGYSAQSFLQLVESHFGKRDAVPAGRQGEFGELHIKESAGERFVSSGVYARFTA